MSSWIQSLFQATKPIISPQHDYLAADVADEGSAVESIARPFIVSEVGADSEQCST